MAADFYVVRHHGAWRIRVNGKHHGEYDSRLFGHQRRSDGGSSCRAGGEGLQHGDCQSIQPRVAVNRKDPDSLSP